MASVQQKMSFATLVSILERNYADRVNNNARTKAALGFTITASETAPSGYNEWPGTTLSASSIANIFTIEGGWLGNVNYIGPTTERCFNVRNVMTTAGSTPGVDSGYSTNAYKALVKTTAQTLVWRVYFSQNASKTSGVRFRVNDQYVSFTPLYKPTPNVAGFAYYSIDLSPLGNVAKCVTLEAQSGIQVSNVYAPKIATCWKPDLPRKPRVIVASDSYGQGYSPDRYSGAVGYTGLLEPAMWDSYDQVFGDLFGVDAWPSSIGGTGYAAGGAGFAGPALQNRLSDITYWSPDFVLLGYGYNDGSKWADGTITQAAVQAAIPATISGIRAALLNTPMIAIGAWPQQINSQKTSVEGYISAAIAALGASDRSAFVPMIGAYPVLLNGSGNTTAPAADGNRDLYGASDGVHLSSPVGYAYLAQRIAEPVLTALRAMQ